VRFLQSNLGRGVFFVFVGTLCFPNSDASKFYYWIIGCGCIVNGGFNIGLVFLCGKELEALEAEESSQPPVQSTAPSSGVGGALAVASAAHQAGVKPEHAIKGAKMAHDAGVRPEHVVAGAKAASNAGVTPAHVAAASSSI